MGIIIVKIDKKEVESLVKNGVTYGYNGISHTYSRHRKTYYIAESFKNMKLHNEYQEMIAR